MKYKKKNKNLINYLILRVENLNHEKDNCFPIEQSIILFNFNEILNLLDEG